MKKHKRHFNYQADGTLDLFGWLEKIKNEYPTYDVMALQKACLFVQHATQGLTTFYGQPYLELGLEVVETILQLKLLDPDTAPAAMIGSTVSLNSEQIDTIKKELGENIVKLVLGLQQMDIIPTIQSQQQVRNKLQPENIRRMLLAMGSDIRVVIIKLAERLCFIRGIKNIPIEDRKRFAQEILDIYAPLANRLGIGQLKWELEDYAFHCMDPAQYKHIAGFLAERRVDRESRIQKLIAFLKEKCQQASLHAEVTGRAKHIYSIYLKKNRKNSSYADIYDSSAVRILVPTIQDCYAALSLVHSLWPPIMAEFDDYIAHPKANGYRSIHTAVIGEDNKHFEIQIRTHAMHEEAERGIAAHWLYKENSAHSAVDKTTKISYLHQLLDWHQEVANTSTLPSRTIDREIYVITPVGDIFSLAEGATPLDFAYHIHSQLGHRCRGAKVNGQIVPLTYALRTGDKVEIITILQGNPSRDWLNPELGYVKTSRARNKIAHYFKQQAYNEDLETGRNLLEKELARSGIGKSTVSLNQIARQINLKDEDTLFVSLARGNIRLMQVMQLIQPSKPVDTTPIVTSIQKAPRKNYGSAIAGGADFLTRLAKCCKPIPGDAIIGYITQGRGLSIHKKNCNNVQHLGDPRRFMDIHWDDQNLDLFSTDLKIIAHYEKNILQEITSLFSNEKIILLGFHSTLQAQQNKIIITATVQVKNQTDLQRLQHRIRQMPNVLIVERE